MASMPNSSAIDDKDHDSINLKAAKDLRDLREAAGLTQEETAELCGVNPKTISLRENAQVDLGALKQQKSLERAAWQRRLREFKEGSDK